MPLTPPGLSGAIMGGLSSASFTGTNLMDLARGIASGICNWISAMVVTTTDVGAPGVGTGVMPLIVPAPSIQAQVLSGLSSQSFKGTSLSSLSQGLGTGLNIGLMMGIIQTTHPSVGVGTATPKFTAPPLGPLIMAGLLGAGVKGTEMSKLANGIGSGVENVFSSLVLQVPIVGSIAPISGPMTGVGFIM